jgi:hypothetical protein
MNSSLLPLGKQLVGEGIVLPFRQVVEARNGCEELAFMLRMMSRCAIRSVRTKGKEKARA